MEIEDYKELIVKLINESKDQEYLSAVLTFVKHYPQNNDKGSS